MGEERVSQEGEAFAHKMTTSFALSELNALEA
jgi:hypothetical protein